MASNRNSIYDTNFAVAFLWPITTLSWLLITYIALGLATIVIALLFAAYYWSDPVQATTELYQLEAARVSALSSQGTAQLSSLVMIVTRWTYWLFFQATTIHDATYAALNHIQVNQLDQIYFDQFIKRNAREIFIAMNVIQVYGIRLGFLISAIPLFVLIYFAATVDGLTERYIRRACSGRESSDMYKIGKISKLFFFATGSTVYLCFPIMMNPFWLIASLALIMCIGTRIQWTFYKKYL